MPSSGYIGCNSIDRDTLLPVAVRYGWQQWMGGKTLPPARPAYL